MSDEPVPGAGAAKEIAIVLIAVLVMVACMAGYWSYPFPNGKYPDVWGFIALFFKEALLLALFALFALVALVVALLGTVFRLFLRLAARFRRAA